MALSQKQKTFCECIVSGMSGKDSYITAYNSKGSAQNAYNEASKLLLREDIQEEIKRLRKPVEEAAQITALSDREKIKKILWDFVNDGNLSPETRMRASDQINRMNSEYVNINKNIEEHGESIKELDTDALKKLTEEL